MWRAALVAFAALWLCACVSVKEPVGTTVGFVNDPALEGLWIGKADADKPDTYFHVIANDDASFTVVGVTPRRGDDKAGWGTLALTTAVLGGHRYMNIRETSANGDAKSVDPAQGNIVAFYTVDADTLTLSAFDPEKVAAAIRAHRIAGTVQRTNLAENVAITAGGVQLDALLAKPDAPDLFKAVLVLHRVK